MAREKDGWLICDEPRGGRHCGGRIGSIDELDRIAPGMEERRILHILPGWRRDRQRVYHEPPHALERRERGHAPRPLPAAMSGMKRNRGPSYRAAWFEPTPLGWIVKLRCSDCQHVHELTAAGLGVAPIAPHSIYTEREHKPA